ncbi:hypothetical protein [Streptomyces parvus]|uniref:hypothetical protein n=1 Tax=Streptomyces parvus TaxID=66428 RepID=UPI0035D5EF58
MQSFAALLHLVLGQAGVLGETPLDHATTAFRTAVARPGIAEAFDRDFGGLPQDDQRAA